MKKLLVVLLVIVMSTFVLATPASASPPIPVSGTISVLYPIEPPIRTDVGGNCLVEHFLMLGFSGEIIEGTAPTLFRIVVKGQCEGSFPGKNDETWNAKGTFTGQVGDAEGTFDFDYRAIVEAGGDFEATITILNGTGELANLHGVLFEEGNLQGEDSYSGQIHFDP